MSWWKKGLTDQSKATEARTDEHADLEQPTVVVEGRDVGLDGLYVGTRSETLRRAQAAMPGTASIPPILALVPPPVDPDLARAPVTDDGRDYGPDPIAEYSLAFPACGVFAIGNHSGAETLLCGAHALCPHPDRAHNLHGRGRCTARGDRHHRRMDAAGGG